MPKSVKNSSRSSKDRKKKRRKLSKLTNAEVIQLFRDGKYTADLENGVVISGRTGKPIYTYVDGKYDSKYHRQEEGEGYLWIRLYHQGRRRALSLAQAIWMVGSGVPIPNLFEIHHRDSDTRNNRWKNLFCLYNLDHRKLHVSDEEREDLVTQDTPF